MADEEKKVAKLEVINWELAVGYVHLMEFHVGPSEAALWAAATTFLPVRGLGGRTQQTHHSCPNHTEKGNS